MKLIFILNRETIKPNIFSRTTGLLSFPTETEFHFSIPLNFNV